MGTNNLILMQLDHLKLLKLLEHAVASHQAGKLPEAERFYRAVLETSPNQFDALHYLGLLQAQRGSHAEAQQLIRQALDANPQSAEANANLGNVLLEVNRAEDALAFFRKSLAIQPGNVQTLYGQGNALCALARHGEALASYDASLSIDPQFIPALNNRGNLLKELERYPEAFASFDRALAIEPGNPGILVNLGVVQRALKRSAAALASFEQALALKPDYAEALNNRGNALVDLRRYAEALASFSKALALKPDYAEALNNRGTALEELKRHAEALASFEQALLVKPDYVEALNNRGNALKNSQRHEEALASFERALTLKPDYAEAHSNYGNVLKAQGRLDDAIVSYRKALSFKPGYAEAHSNLANALNDQGRLDEAIAGYRQALALKPDYAEAHNGLGVVLQGQGKLDDAVASYNKALALKPDFAEAHINLGNALMDQGSLDAAIASYRVVLSLRPDDATAHSNLLFCLNYHPDLSAEDIFAEYRRWNERHARPLLCDVAHANNRDSGRRLRIGYVSPDLRRHSARHFIEPLLAHHDKTRFEVFAYAEVATEDAVSARFKSQVDYWRRTVGLSMDEMAALIRSDGIDILVDLAGHTKGNRLQVFARKPAPVQVSSVLGYGYTTGLDAIDYFLADRKFSPPGYDSLFAETLVRLPIAAAYRPAEGMGEPGPLPALQTKRITFGSLTRSVRVNHRVIRTWAAILNRLPDARIAINSRNFQNAAMQTRIQNQFVAYGIEAERLILGCDSPPWDVLRKIDIGLDCFPHNSGTTLFESLYMGVPFVTLAGRPSVGRLGSSILTAVGHPEWIAGTEEEYIDKTVALAADIDYLASVRAGLRDQMARSSIMNEPAFARSVESAYREMWRRWRERGNVETIELG